MLIVISFVLFHAVASHYITQNMRKIVPLRHCFFICLVLDVKASTLHNFFVPIKSNKIVKRSRIGLL